MNSELMVIKQSTIRELIFNNYLIGKEDEELSNDDSFLEKGVIDSTGVLELIMFVEETYGIEVADEEVIPDNFDSVNKLCKYIGRKISFKEI